MKKLELGYKYPKKLHPIGHLVKNWTKRSYLGMNGNYLSKNIFLYEA